MIIIYPNSYNLPVLEEIEGLDMFREDDENFEEFSLASRRDEDGYGALLDEIDEEYVDESLREEKNKA